MLNKKRFISLASAIKEAQMLAMKKDKNVLLIGLGVDDPKGIFGTTKGLNKIFKKGEQVFDFPTAENAMTGIAIGASISGKKPIIVHQRVEFSLLSVEQIINQAAKWFFMSGGTSNSPIVIRLIIGRGWGQGPQHSQSLETIFSHIPGLKVISLSTPKSAKGLILSSIKDKNPVIIFEHRWLHDIKGHVPKKYYTTPLDRAQVLKKGSDITLISSSYMIIECLRSASILKDFSINAEVVDIRSLRPLDINTLIKSVRKTKNTLIVDNGWMSYGISSEIMARIFENLTKKEKEFISMNRIGPLESSVPSTRELAKYCYKDYKDIVKSVLKILKKNNFNTNNLKKYSNNVPSDQPNKNFFRAFLMKNNYSQSITPQTKDNWKNLKISNREKLIKKILEENTIYSNFEVVETPDNGQIVIRIEKIIPANERGLILLNLEEKLKKTIDEGLTIWCEPVGDKSKLRKLRGIQIKT